MAYAIYKIDMNAVKTPEEYEKAMNRPPVHVCETITKVKEFCKRPLHRQRCGYSCTSGNTEYIITKSS